MSGGQIALVDSGINFGTYYASEIDKYAIAQTQVNFPNTVQLGNVERWREWDIDWENVDLILAGSPCQGFSFSGKQLNFDDPRSKLFFVFADILEYAKTKNPNVKYLLENVFMDYTYQSVISNRLKVYPVEINSALVSAQSRVRLYWSNFKTRYDEALRIDVTAIPLPYPKNVAVRDILDETVEHVTTPLVKMMKTKRFYEVQVSERGIRPYKPDARKSSLSELGTVVFKHQKTCTLTTKDVPKILETFVPHNPLLSEFRKLTTVECARLQTIPSWYKFVVSDAQTLKLLGNGWTIEVIKHILKYL